LQNACREFCSALLMSGQENIVPHRRRLVSAMYVQRVHTSEQAKARLVKLAEEGRLPKAILEAFQDAPPEEVRAALRGSLVNAWELGLRDCVRGGRPT